MMCSTSDTACAGGINTVSQELANPLDGFCASAMLAAFALYEVLGPRYARRCSSFAIEGPKNWVADRKVGHRLRVCSVYYEKGSGTLRKRYCIPTL